ncbi:glycosyltransferase family 2 protein [Taibaiella helva]|uniref:glycosyltransferase family 2 protein n=1 Tax=Taibaiella helva TaxID=2301235 RepID=UPI000E58CAF8|nr:glycosyltransferase [Taibaiella helva]
MLQKKVSVIIVSYNVQYFLELCLHSVIRATAPVDAEIIVIDNQSSDDSCNLVAEKFPGVMLIANKENVGFSRANNQGIAVANGTYIHFLNPDTVVPEDFYTRTLDYLDRHPQTGGLGPRLIDGRGVYAPDSKKSFPTFWTSIYKLTGLSKLFPRSTVFNRYYAAQVNESETAGVDILSGCCLLVRRSALEQAGGRFDESYFMYCEDVDLCHRIRLAGFQNIYFHEVSVIHYKGESTRKLSYRYMKVFYEAHALFVRKYYPRRLAAIYIAGLKMVLGLRNAMKWGEHLFSLFKMFLLDAILLTLVTLLIKNFWFDTILQVSPASTQAHILIRTTPLFIVLWLLSLFLNGAYDKPFSLFKAGRGMVLGTILVLAGYGLMPLEYRYSRGIVLFSGMTGTVVLLLSRWLLSLLHWIRLVPRGKVDYKTAIVGNPDDYAETLFLMERMQYNLEVIGRITPAGEPAQRVLGPVTDLPGIQRLYRINEIIFNSGSVTYKEIMEQMEACAPAPFYKIHVPGGEVLLGSNSSRHHAEEFSLDKKYRIATVAARRNKRIADISSALVFLAGFPLWALKVKSSKVFFRQIIQVLGGKKTWIGYTDAVSASAKLPFLKPPVLPPYALKGTRPPDTFNEEQLAELYAVNYNALDDLRILWINLSFLGEKN